VSAGAPLYDGPVERRLALRLLISLAGAVLFGIVIALLEGSPYTLGIVLGIIGFAGVFIALRLLMPTRIEARPGEVRLFAPKATTRYDASAMVLLPGTQPDAFVFARKEPHRKLAVFRATDPDQVRQAFGTAGVTVVSGHEGLA
jgi:hypothetical protein